MKLSDSARASLDAICDTSSPAGRGCPLPRTECAEAILGRSAQPGRKRTRGSPG